MSPFTFRKSFRVMPGVRININKSSRSITVGPKWLKRTWSTTGGRHYQQRSTRPGELA